jgi:hypothetical protein
MIRFLLALLLGLSASAVAAPQPAKPLFASDAPLALTIEAPVQRLVRDRGMREELPGTLSDGAGNRLPITLELRGITRRTSEVCDFPPLRVRFTAPPPATSPFAGQRRLKLVTHCRKGRSGQEDVLLEYAAYRLFNRLSPTSIRVRLGMIDYRGADGRPIVNRPGFFIEDLDDLAARTGLPRLRAGPRIPTTDLAPREAALYGLFQHMIANHDWSMRAGPVGDNCCHNAELLGSPGPGRTIPVPYDFDFSGFVGAPYALPPEQIGLNSVKERKYRGYCVHNAAVREAARSIRSQWPALMAELDSIPGLDERARANARSFLAGFYADIATDSAVETRILRNCVG